MTELRQKVKELIVEYEAQKDIQQLQKMYIIEKILKDDKAFFSMYIEDAINILKDLKIENYKEKYLELVSFDNFWEIYKIEMLIRK